MRLFPFTQLLLIALILPTSAQTPEIKKTHLEGRVLSQTGEAIRKATVRLQGPNAYAETTDNDGKFVFEEIPAGRYQLTAEKSGFVSTRYGARSATGPATPLALADGQELKGLDMKMTPQGVILGRVVDMDGDPLPQLQVRLWTFRYQTGRRLLFTVFSSTTDDQGAFRAGSLNPGKYYVSAQDPRFRAPAERSGRPGSPQQGMVNTYYPNALDVKNAAAIEVTAGAEVRGIEIRMRRERVFAIRGKAAGGASSDNVMLSIAPKDDPQLGGPLVLNRIANGTFEFGGLPAGSYTIRTLPAGLVNGAPVAALTGRVDVTLSDADVSDLVLTLSAGSEITGSVTFDGGDFKTLTQQAAQRPGGIAGTAATGPAGALATPRVTIVLRESESNGLSNTQSNAQVDEAGAFTLKAIAAAKYGVALNGLPQGTYIKSIQFGGQDVTHAPIDLGAGGSGRLDIVLSSKAASLTGTVRDSKGQPAAGVYVTLWSKLPDAGSPTGGSRLSTTDQTGTARFQGLAPGDYYIAAWEDAEPGMLQGVEFLGRFTSSATSMKLNENGQESAEIKIVPADKVAAEIAKLGN